MGLVGAAARSGPRRRTTGLPRGDVRVPLEGVAQAVRFALVARAAAGLVATAEAPGEGVAAADGVAETSQAGGLDAEAVQAETAGGEGADDVLDLVGVLAAANAADPDDRLFGKPDAAGLVEVGAPLVVGAV